MPTWQHQRTEAARRAELFGGSGRGFHDEDGPGTRASALEGPSLTRRSNHTRSDGATLGGGASQHAPALTTTTTWTRMASAPPAAAGVRPRGYFDGAIASPDGNRNSVDSNTSKTSSSSTFVQKRMVHRAIQQHQGTTASAERSLAVAENCLDIGVTTLEEVSRQGEGLDKTERGLDMLEEEVLEASALIKFMSRCCLFQVLCCCCADSKEDMRRDRTRRQRLKQRRGEDEVVRRAISMATQDKKSSYGIFDAREDAELERVASKYRPASQRRAANPHAVPRNPHQDIITDEQLDVINSETRKQDELLDQIGDAVDKLKVVGEALQTEFQEQDAQIERLEERVVEGKLSLNALTTKARRIR